MYIIYTTVYFYLRIALKDLIMLCIFQQQGYTPLYCAVMDKNPLMVEMLLRFGIDPCVTEWVNYCYI